MDCYICNSKSFDENHCEQCRFELQPLIEWMADITGRASFKESNFPFLELHEDEARYVAGFIAGGQMPFKIIKVDNYTRLVRSNFPAYSYASFTRAL